MINIETIVVVERENDQYQNFGLGRFLTPHLIPMLQ